MLLDALKIVMSARIIDAGNVCASQVAGSAVQASASQLLRHGAFLHVEAV
jgi:hypothetical protein